MDGAKFSDKPGEVNYGLSAGGALKLKGKLMLSLTGKGNDYSTPGWKKDSWKNPYLL